MPFRLIVAINGLDEEDVTLSGRYMPIVMLTKTVREALCEHAGLRQPFLDLLHHVYKNSNVKATLEEVRYRHPDDEDIRYFFRWRFPNIRLVTSKGGAEFEWGYTNVGVDAACDDNVQIAYQLAECLMLSAKSAPYRQRIDASQIIASYIAVLLHELAHRLLVWWSRGNCRTPDLGPLLRESGRFIEEAFLGGVLEGWWAKDKGGDFQHLRKVIIRTRSGRFLELDEYSATAFYKRFNTSTTHIPLSHEVAMAEAFLGDPAKTSRAKINHGIMLDTSDHHSSVTSSSSPIGLGITRCPIINDTRRL